MSEKLIPLPNNHEHWIHKLFSISPSPDGPLVLTEQQYAVYWPLVDGFWTHTNTQRHKHGKSISHYYSCRLGKGRVSSKAERYPTENLSGKSRVTSFRSPVECCKMRIKITESIPVPGKFKTYTVEQVIPRDATNFFQHNHTIEESWKRKRSSFLTNIIRDELAKGYTPAQVKDRLKGTGRAGGYERLESVGGAFIDR